MRVFNFLNLDKSLEKSAQAFNLKKVVMLITGTLLLGTLVQGAEIKYSGSDAGIVALISSPEVKVRMGISCKIISESRGLLHEFDTLGDIENPGHGIFSPRSTREEFQNTYKAQLSIVEKTSSNMGFNFSGLEHQVQIEFNQAPEGLKKYAEGILQINAQSQGSAIIDLSSDTFLKCVAFKNSSDTQVVKGDQ